MPSLLGIAALSVAAVVMPLLAQQSASCPPRMLVRLESRCNGVCALGYLSIIALAGLVVNAFWGITSADPVAALWIIPPLPREGWQALKGRPCDCC
jgi:hypothetical protein